MVKIQIRPLNPRLRDGLITLSWGLTTSSVLIFFIFQGYFVPGFNIANREISGILLAYTLIFLVAVISGMILSEFSVALTGFFASLGVAAVVEYLVLVLPSILGIAGPDVLANIGLPPISDVAVTIVFSSLFPVPIILGLVGSIVGAILGERILD